jgi:hypothetical protein
MLYLLTIATWPMTAKKKTMVAMTPQIHIPENMFIVHDAS